MDQLSTAHSQMDSGTTTSGRYMLAHFKNVLHKLCFNTIILDPKHPDILKASMKIAKIPVDDRPGDVMCFYASITAVYFIIIILNIISSVFYRCFLC